MLRIKKISDVIGKNVLTSEGDFFGQIEDVNLVDNKIDGWKIRVSSGFLSMFGGARGVIIPHQFVKAMGDVVIVNKGQLPLREEALMSAGMDSSEESM
ncbi:MAG: PRC-barrel domain-containing protein [Nanoarchaeota archaeon]|nr:PRC-barrel domain-containing protein [Nanoarchaeota archaeon]